MNILDQIVEKKKSYLRKRKKDIEFEQIVDSELYLRNCYNLEPILRDRKASIIAEFKRKSPSVSDINIQAKIDDTIQQYKAGGASGVSVLTDHEYFGGSNQDLTQARAHINLPILRKDFIIDDYQIHEAKAIGADIILLIAYCLSKNQAEEYTLLAQSMGLEVLFEIHEIKELSKMPPSINILGVNNRNLTNFAVDYNYAIEVYNDLPSSKIKISESGIKSQESYVQTMNAGYKACLVGEYLMKDQNPEKTIQELINAAS